MLQRLGSNTQKQVVDIIVVSALFFAVRWQARDIYNNLKVSLSVTVVMGMMFYTAVYLSMVYAMFKGQGFPGRAKGLGVVTALWAVMWVPIWGIILVLSRKSSVEVTDADELLAPELGKPKSPLARAVKKTSVNACSKLVQCENSSSYKNFKYLVSKQQKCEECLASNKCPIAGEEEDSTACGPSRSTRCFHKCTPAAMLERYATNGLCPNAVAYATVVEDSVRHIEEMCNEDKGMCVYGCDTRIDGDVCNSGWKSYEKEELSKNLRDISEEGQGYPSMSECMRKHKGGCRERQCASEPVNQPSRYQGNNCFCNTKYVTLPRAPCLRLESLCDRTSPQYLAAKALKGARAVESDVRNIDQLQLAEDVRALDMQLSDALMF